MCHSSKSPKSHCSIRVGCGQNSRRRGSTNHAELDKIYFCKIKFSTQVLISVWKIEPRCQLTSLSSTCCSCLHNFSAADFFARWRFREAAERMRTAKDIESDRRERLRRKFLRDLQSHFESSAVRKQISTTSAVSRGGF